MKKLKKAGSNWVDGDLFFDREAELRELRKRVEGGTHTFLTGQRRMGKTSLVRELLRRLKTEGDFETVFVNLESADSAAEAVVEIANQSWSARGTKARIGKSFSNIMNRVEEISSGRLRVKLREWVDSGQWKPKGNEMLAALARNRRPIVLAVDEISIFVGRMLLGGPDGKREAEEFLSWLRWNGQQHKGQIRLIIFGSVGLQPILREAELSRCVNIFSVMRLDPWEKETALDCLTALANTYECDLSLAVREDICRRLRCLIPHHVQFFFDTLEEYLERAGRRRAELGDVDRVYEEILNSHDNIYLDHYHSRLRYVFGGAGRKAACDFLTEAAVNDGILNRDIIDRYDKLFRAWPDADSASAVYILEVLEHDGYLERRGNDYRFVSGLLEHWWRARYGGSFVSIKQKSLPLHGD